MDLFDGRIHIHPRKRLKMRDVAYWPAPRKHQFYAIDSTCRGRQMPLSTYISALEVARQRPDINSVGVRIEELLHETIRRALDSLLNSKDRSWSVRVYLPDQISIDRPELERALSVLQNVHYLSLFHYNFCDMNRDILDSLPSFSQLKRLDLRRWRKPLNDMLEIFDNYAFAPLVSGMCPYNILTQEFPILEEPLRALCLNFYCYSTSELSGLVAGLTSLSSLETICVSTFSRLSCRDLEPLLSLLKWLSSSQCPVKDLSFEHCVLDHYQMFLTILPRIPKLKTIRLRYWGREYDLKLLFPIFLETPLLETIVLNVSQLKEETCNQILSFQLDNRPRLFAVQLDYGRNMIEGTGPPKIHHVSLVYQTLRNFRNSKDHASFPMSAWSIVLEKLGSAFDCPSPDIHAVGVDARFQVLQELLERPHILLKR